MDCIYEGERMLYIHPDECIECGACEPVCPVEAIFYEDDLPGHWQDYKRINAIFFEDIGSPGGASKAGVIPRHVGPETMPGTQLAIPVADYTGIIQEFAGIAPKPPGTVALLDSGDGDISLIINVLLLFHDRVLLVGRKSSGPRDVQLTQPTSSLRDAGLVDVADEDYWLQEVADSVLRSCELLAAHDEAPARCMASGIQEHGSSGFFGRLRAAALRTGAAFGPPPQNRDMFALARLLFPQMICSMAKRRGLSFDHVITEPMHMDQMGDFTFRRPPPGAILSDFEDVAPNIAALGPDDLVGFRNAHGELFRSHLSLVRRGLRQVEAHSGETGSLAEMRDAIAESAYGLRKAARELSTAGDHGVWSLGAVLIPSVFEGSRVLELAPGEAGTDLGGTSDEGSDDLFSWVLAAPEPPRWTRWS